jgi:large subunit ribosomal protein L23e
MKRGRSGKVGVKMKISMALSTSAIINCADNSGAKNIYMISAFEHKARQNRLPKASIGDLIICSVKKGKPILRKKVTSAVIIR